MTKTITILDKTGAYDAEGIDSLIEELQESKEVTEIKPVNLKKIISIIIEAQENIFKYHSLGEIQKKLFQQTPPTMKIERIKGQVFLHFSNPVIKKDAAALSQKLESLTLLNEEELKMLYIKTIKNGEFTEQGGAGLGFIKMSRVSKNQFSYHFLDNNGASLLFVYKVQIDD